jgi:hypothetical protein
MANSLIYVVNVIVILPGFGVVEFAVAEVQRKYPLSLTGARYSFGEEVPQTATETEAAEHCDNPAGPEKLKLSGAPTLATNVLFSQVCGTVVPPGNDCQPYGYVALVRFATPPPVGL